VTRPPVTVVMPFAGDAAAAQAALAALAALTTTEGDQLIMADNSGTAAAAQDIQIVPATGERSPAHARNTGAQAATNDWILFLDADCVAPPGLLDDYFKVTPAADTGAIAGEVTAVRGHSLAARYAESRSFLGQQAHLAHPYRPRAAAANLLVRRAAFLQLGGFLEGLRAAEDTDFCWRLQAAGWQLELAPGAVVGHRYRESLRDLRSQWRGYAAGRAWLARRYDGFTPEPALQRAVKRAGRAGRVAVSPIRRSPAPPAQTPRARATPTTTPRATPVTERAEFFAIDALLALDELAGFVLSNRPRAEHTGPAAVVLVADTFPAAGDPMVDFARTVARARVEAASRPQTPTAAELPVAFREDDGALDRVRSLLALALRRPIRLATDRRRGGPSLLALAPAVRRLAREPHTTTVRAIGGLTATDTARRLARLAQKELR